MQKSTLFYTFCQMNWRCLSHMDSERSTLWDSSKGIAIIIIFLVHNYVLGNIVSNYDWVNMLLSKGRYGVEITFIANAFFFAKLYDLRVRSKKISSWEYIFKMICKTIPIYYLALFSIILFDYIYSGSNAGSLANIIFHFLGLHALNYEYFNTVLPGSGYIGILYITWILYLFYCKFVDSKEKSIIGAFVILFISYELKNLILLNSINSANYSDIATIISYYFRAFCAFSAGNAVYHLTKNRKQDEGFKRIYTSIVTIVLLIIIIVFCKDDYIRDEQFILLVSILIYLNIPASSKIIDNKFFSLE